MKLKRPGIGSDIKKKICIFQFNLLIINTFFYIFFILDGISTLECKDQNYI